MTRLSKIAAALIVAVGACSAHAFDIYAGGSLGLTKFHSDGLTDTSDTGLKLFAGTPITPMFGIEGGYVDLGNIVGQMCEVDEEILGLAFWDSKAAFETSLPKKTLYRIDLYTRVV